jgi:hypothetical protein
VRVLFLRILEEEKEDGYRERREFGVVSYGDLSGADNRCGEGGRCLGI